MRSLPPTAVALLGRWRSGATSPAHTHGAAEVSSVQDTPFARRRNGVSWTLDRQPGRGAPALTGALVPAAAPGAWPAPDAATPNVSVNARHRSAA